MQIRFEKKSKLVVKSCGAPAVLQQLKIWQSIFVGRTGVSAFFFAREGAKTRRRQRQRMAACLAAARQFTPPVGRREVGADWRVRLFFRTRRREGAKKTKAKAKAKKGGLSCRCAAIHAAGLGFLSHAKARRPSSSGRTLACGSWAGAGVVGAGTLRRLLGLCGGDGDAGGADGAGGGAADADSEASFLGDDLWPDGAFGGAADHDGVLKGEAVGF